MTATPSDSTGSAEHPTTVHDPLRGHFTIAYSDDRYYIGCDMGTGLDLTPEVGARFGPLVLSPDEARALAAALTTWADRRTT